MWLFLAKREPSVHTNPWTVPGQEQQGSPDEDLVGQNVALICFLANLYSNTDRKLQDNYFIYLSVS